MSKRHLRRFGTIGRYLYLCISLALGATFLDGCGPSSYGSLQYSPEANQMFENNQLIPNYTYYYSGFQRVPYGIIGIDNNYTLRSSIWKPFELDPEVLKQLSYRMDQVYTLNPRASWILDQEGNRVGIWYSSQSATKIRIEENRQIVVLAPEPPDLRGIP
jgi:hypothetical protein